MALTDADRARAYRARKRDAGNGVHRDDFVTDSVTVQAERDASRDVTEEPSLPDLRNASRRELQRILDDPSELGSTKVAATRAVKDLEGKGCADSSEEQRVLAIRSTLALLEPEERLAYLREMRGPEPKTMTTGGNDAA